MTDKQNCVRCGKPLSKFEAHEMTHCIEWLRDELELTREDLIKQSEDVQRNWLSPVEAMGLRKRIKDAENEAARLMDALAKSDPLKRVYFGTLPVLHCIHCGGRRGRFENEVHHETDCIWLTSQKREDSEK